MPLIDIKTKLRIFPKPKKPEEFIITRGATAVIDISLLEKNYTFDNIEQLTVAFKNDGIIYTYNIFDYFKLTTDTLAILGKTYYNRIDSNNTYKFEKANVSMGGDVTGLYETRELIEAEQPDENKQLNKHFIISDDKKIISFKLNSTETAELVPTCDLHLEIATRINIDSKVFVLIDKYKIIRVVNSIYGESLEV